MSLDVVVRTLTQSVADAERALPAGPLPAGTFRVVMTRNSVTIEPGASALWLPAAQPGLGDPPEFSDAELLEYQNQQSQALAIYRGLLTSPDSAIRAGALVRIGRMAVHDSRWPDALDAYRRLSSETKAQIAGAPADFQGRRAICATLLSAGRVDDLGKEASQLESDLLGGRWQLDGPAWAIATGDLETWLGRPVIADATRRKNSVAIEWLWSRLHDHSLADREWIPVDRSVVTALVHRSPDSIRALLLPSEAVASWLGSAVAGLRDGPKAVALGPRGVPLSGDVRPESPDSVVLASASDTGLPWSLQLSGPESSVLDESAERMRLLTVGLGAVIVLVVGGGYMLWRVMRRELEVSRLQTEFVSAVSHEFRTPLTSLRHATELLQEHDDVAPERRRSFYVAMERDTGRLQRLVDSLLDFSRMQAGRKAYDLRPVDARELVDAVVEEFQATSNAAASVRVEGAAAGDAWVRADAPALAHALWNLLENAVKYTAGRPDITVMVAARHDDVRIAVRDNGIGIPAAEHEQIFRRFVRGAAALKQGIPGTGLGLALVSHVIEAHHGTVAVESREGQGSTFTMTLPLEQAG